MWRDERRDGYQRARLLGWMLLGWVLLILFVAALAGTKAVLVAAAVRTGLDVGVLTFVALLVLAAVSGVITNETRRRRARRGEGP